MDNFMWKSKKEYGAMLNFPSVYKQNIQFPCIKYPESWNLEGGLVLVT